jgi:hypothetical protein
MTINQGKENWPEWSVPSNKSMLQLAKVIMPHIKILSPDIVKLVVEDNNNQFKKWKKKFNNIGVRTDIYLWENSPITFPGIRRHVGKDEEMDVKKNRKSAKGVDSILLDDNSFPKELWSFVLRGRKADKYGPTNFSLAHVVDHKDYKSRHAEEINGFEKSKEKNLYSGLHTSCANTVWVPNNLLKPTDHKGNLRKLLIQLVHKYYDSVCTILPHGKTLNLENIANEWHIDRFPKPTIVGNIDNTKDFITYRNKIMKERIDTLLLENKS